MNRFITRGLPRPVVIFRLAVFWIGCGLYADQHLAHQVQGQEPTLAPKVYRQLDQLARAYKDHNPFLFTELGKELLNRTGRDGLQAVNLELQKRDLPSIHEMVAKVRLDATKSNIRLPAPSWNEFRGLVPLVVNQVNELIQSYESHPLNTAEVTSPEKFADYEKWIWQLHVFRNQFNALQRIALDTRILKRKFSRQLEKERSRLTPDQAKPFEVEIGRLAERITGILQGIDEREAEIRVLRIDDASSIVVESKAFADQFDAAFALAFDQLFFQKFFSTAKKENRKFQNPDLNDESIMVILRDLIDSAQTSDPNLFEKAKLFYVASHWWFEEGMVKARWLVVS